MASGVVVGIDVGGEKKGFHAVVLRDNRFEVTQSREPKDIVKWCQDLGAAIAAVDAPCLWSRSQCESSRLCERELKIGGRKIHCFATPTQARARGNRFYCWVRNGLELYRHLREGGYELYDGRSRNHPRDRLCVETFPHAIVCALEGRVVSCERRCKRSQRCEVLRKNGCDDLQPLRNLDFVDASLCAIVAKKFLSGEICQFGAPEEGFIVVPKFAEA